MRKIVVILLSVIFGSCSRYLTSSVATAYNSQGSPTAKWAVGFDRNGNIISRLNYILVDGVFVEDIKMVCSCNCSSGSTDSVRTYFKMADSIWEPLSKVIDSYNEQMLKVRTTSLSYNDGSWNQEFIVTWTYDSLSRISSISSREWQDLSNYDAEGNAIRTMSNLEDGEYKIHGIVFDTVDSKGNVIKSVVKTKAPVGWSNNSTTNRIYDENNRMQTETINIFEDNVIISSAKIEYAYNKSGQVIRETTMHLNDGEWKVSYQNEWEYETSGKVKKNTFTRMSNEQQLDKVITEYEYDKRGNMTLETTKRESGDTGNMSVAEILVIENHYNYVLL